MNGNGKDLLDITNNNQAPKSNTTNGPSTLEKQPSNGVDKPPTTTPTIINNNNKPLQPQPQPTPSSNPNPNRTTTTSTPTNQTTLTQTTTSTNGNDDVIVPYSSRALSYRPYRAFSSRSSIVAKKPCNHMTFKEENIGTYTDANGVVYKVSDYVYMDINKPNQPFAIACILDFKLVCSFFWFCFTFFVLSLFFLLGFFSFLSIFYPCFFFFLLLLLCLTQKRPKGF